MWDLNNGIIWCHYIIIVNGEKGYIVWTWMLTWLRFKVCVINSEKERNASYGQEDFPFKHFKLFEYGWLGTYIAMIFWVAKIFINQSSLLWSLFLQNLLGETLFFHQTFSTFAKLRNWEFFSNLATPNIISL